MTDPELFQVVSAGNALRKLLDQLPAANAHHEAVSIERALGRYLAQDVYSAETVPAFDRSIMDGFAVRAADTFGASEANPAYLNIKGRILMGMAAGVSIGPGEAAHIPTGGMLPEGTDAVVMVEYTALLDETSLEITKAVAPGENVVQTGEDIRQNQHLFSTGRRLKTADLGVLAATGASEVKVFLPLKVGILSTGDEIVEAGVTPGPGQVRDVNYFVLSGMVRLSGAEPVNLGICRDDFALMSQGLRHGIKQCDIVIISGGTSVGTADLTPAVVNDMGKPGVLVHGLSIKPGKPAIVALVRDTPVLGLPGHPLGAIDVYNQIADPLIRYMNSQPLQAKLRLRMRVRLSRSLASVAGREDRIRVSLKQSGDEIWAEPILGRSGLISLMVNADAVAIVPFEAEGLNRGEEIEVELI